MKSMKRLGNAFHTRVGAYIFFALAAIAFAFFYSTKWAYGWIAELYPLDDKFIPALFCAIGLCAAVHLGFLIVGDTFKAKHALRGIHTVFCVLAGVLFGYTTVLLFGLDKGLRPDGLENGLDSLLPSLPLLGTALALPLSAVLYKSLSKKALFTAGAGMAAIALLLSGFWATNKMLLHRARNILDNVAVASSDTELLLPEMPLGVALAYGGTDYTQVIDAGRQIRRPLVDTEVAVEFKLRLFGKTTLHEVRLTVPGRYAAANAGNAKPAVLPELRQWFGHRGNFSVTGASKIWVDPALGQAYLDMAGRFAQDYSEITGSTIAVIVGDAPAAGDFYFKESGEPLDKETYDMAIADHIIVMTSDPVGAHWATRTILQILKQTGGTIPRGLVRDYPKYQVRGFLLDAGRKAIPLEFLEMWVKQMSWYKLNDFHVHLSDESLDCSYWGFRLESDVPGLTSTDVFYTKEQFRDFIAESAARGVNIVPELDTPGHASAFTKARPELARPENPNYLDVQNPEALAFVKEIFAEYMEGSSPVFPQDAVVHIGTDEYKGGGRAEKESFRAYQDALLKFIRDDMGRTPRVWGSQTENSGKTPVTARGVQMDLWNAGYSKPKKMYDLGYGMINIEGGNLYIVPGAGYYHDYLDKEAILNQWRPEHMLGLELPAGDPQVLGGAYAIWFDQAGALDIGVSDVEMFERMFDILPVFSQRLWSSCRDYDVAMIGELTRMIKYAPGTNPAYEVPDLDEYVLLSEPLQLAGGESYMETPIDNIGVGSALEFRVRRAADSDGSPQVLFESDIGQIMAVQRGTGKLGFSRDFRDFSFDYVLPKDEWVRIAIVTEMSKTTLYVNGKKVHTLERTPEGGGKWASLVIPMSRIGSRTNAFRGEVDDVRIVKGANVILK